MTSLWPPLIKLIVQGESNEEILTKYLGQLDETTLHGTTVLHFATLSENEGIIRFILSHAHYLIDQPNEFGETPLHWACKEASISMINCLISFGASISFPDSDDNTPLHWASEYQRKDVIRILLSHGAKQEQNSDGQTPSDVARINSYPECVLLLQSHSK